MTADQYNQNQTQFSVEEPILEKPLVVEPFPAEPVVPVKPKSKIPRWVWGLVGLLVVVLITMIVMALTAPEELAPVQEETVKELAPKLDPFELRLRAAEALLEQTNPTSEKYPFPPVTTDLRID